jgi:hypothetical protein
MREDDSATYEQPQDHREKHDFERGHVQAADVEASARQAQGSGHDGECRRH